MRHFEIVRDVGRYLRGFRQLKVCAEINPANGSTKFYAFHPGRQWYANEAELWGKRVYQDLMRRGLHHGQSIEVFPHEKTNTVAFWLPCKAEKVTVIDTGALKRTKRRIRHERYPGEWDYVDTYSATEFTKWLLDGQNYNVEVFLVKLDEAIENLTYQPKQIEVPVEVEQDSAPCGSGSHDECSDHKNTPRMNLGAYAWTRNIKDVQFFLRAFWRANNRLPTLDETLEYLRANNLYSGTWAKNKAQRCRRVKEILQWHAERFDPTKLSTDNTFIVQSKKIKRWVKRRFRNGMSGKLKKHAVGMHSLGTNQVDVHASRWFVGHLMQIVYFCLSVDPNEDDSVPTDRIKALWRLLPNAPSWNQERFQMVRNELHKARVVNIYDRQHQAGKAWKWIPGQDYPFVSKNCDCVEDSGEIEEPRRKKKEQSSSLYHFGFLDPIPAPTEHPPPSRDGPFWMASTSIH